MFYDDLSVAVNHTSRHDVTIVMGDLNASIGSDRIARRGIICLLRYGSDNDNVSRLLDFCAWVSTNLPGTVTTLLPE